MREGLGAGVIRRDLPVQFRPARNEMSGRAGGGLTGWTGGIVAVPAKAGPAGARFGRPGPVRPGTPAGDAPKARAPRADRSGWIPAGSPAAGAEGTPTAPLGSGAPPNP